MVTPTEQLKPTERNPSSPKVARYTGEVVYIYAFDVAYDMARQPIRELFGQPVAQFAVDASKRSPKFFQRTRAHCRTTSQHRPEVSDRHQPETEALDIRRFVADGNDD